MMKELKENGKYTAPAELMQTLRASFSGYSLSEEETVGTIRETYAKESCLIDPHTAVGLGCVKKYRAETGDNTPVILASTASPFKFAPAVADAIGMEQPDDIFALLDRLAEETGTSVPAPLASTKELPVRFEAVIDPAGMPEIPFTC